MAYSLYGKKLLLMHYIRKGTFVLQVLKCFMRTKYQVVQVSTLSAELIQKAKLNRHFIELGI